MPEPGAAEYGKEMEHRYSRRYPVETEVRLALGGKDSGTFLTRNICHDGMFIDTREVELQPGEKLTAELLEHQPGLPFHPFEVVVMHHTGEGIGVLVPDIDIDLLRIMTWPASDPAVHRAVMTMTGQGTREYHTDIHHKSIAADCNEVHVCRDRTGSGAIVTLAAGPMLDLRAMHLIQYVRDFAGRYRTSQVIVDLGRTLRIQDSGLALLLLLRRNLGRRLRRIRLVNATGAIRQRLMQLPAGFEID